MGLVTLTFDLETVMRVASKAGNPPSKFGHARTLGPLFIRYVCTTRRTDRQADGRTDKSNAYCPLLYGGGGIIIKAVNRDNSGTSAIIIC